MDVLADFPAIGHLILIPSDTLGESIQHEVDRSFIEMILLEGLKTFVRGLNIVQKFALEHSAIETNISPCHIVIGDPIIISVRLYSGIGDEGGSFCDLFYMVA